MIIIVIDNTIIKTSSIAFKLKALKWYLLIYMLLLYELNITHKGLLMSLFVILLLYGLVFVWRVVSRRIFHELKMDSLNKLNKELIAFDHQPQETSLKPLKLDKSYLVYFLNAIKKFLLVFLLSSIPSFTL